MRRFLQLVTRYPMALLLVIAIMCFAGIYSAFLMPVDLFPNLEVPVVNIITHYPGAGPADIEMLVSMPIENGMRSIPGAKRVASTSVQGISEVTVEFAWGVTVRDARRQVLAKLAQVGNRLPAGVSPRLENIGTTLQEVCCYVIYGGNDPVGLRNTVSHDIAGRLMGVDGVSSIDVLGGEQRAFYVRFDPKALARLHLSVNNVVSLLRQCNKSAVAGYLDRSGREYLLRGDARLKTIADIRALPLVKDGERSVLIGDVAKVFEGRVPRHYTISGNGAPAVALIVRKQPGASTLRTVAKVDEAMQRLFHLLPAGVSVKKAYDQSEIIRESRDEIFIDLVIGALLAVFVLYLFLGSLTPTLIVAVTIPLTLVATLSVMHLCGLGFNMVTMTALALAIGMIVDDAIVVTENIHRHRNILPDPVEASINGASEIAGPDASGTFTTVAAFSPLVIMTGIAALFLRPFGITISASLIVSLILSLTLVPLLFSHSPIVANKDKIFPGQRLLGWLDTLLRKTLRFSFRHKGLILGLAILSLGAAGMTGLFGKASVLPAIDEGAILIEYVMPPGTSLAESNRIGGMLDNIAMSDPDVSCVYRRTGSPESGYQIEGVNRGELLIKLCPKARRARSITAIMASLKKAYSRFNGVVFLYHQPTQEKIDESFSGLPALFGVTLYGVDQNRLVDLAARIEKILSMDPALSNIVNNTKEKASEIDVRLDYSRLALYGIEPSQVLTTLQAARLGVEATRIVRQKEDVAVMVKLSFPGKPDIDGIRQLPIVTTTGSVLPLERVAGIDISHIPAAITRINGQREITLIAEVAGSIPKVVSRLREKFRAVALPEGYSMDFTGQYKVLIKTALEMMFAVGAAIILIYLIMVMQFGSWLQPLVILVTIPLALVGALIALFLTRQGIDVSVGMGAVTLVGIAVNNGIVLIDYSNRVSASGTGIEESLVEAASVRLRPILLTTLTTIAALLPTAIGTTVGSHIFQPFAVTVIGGLISATFATLVIVPTLASLASKPDSHTFC